MAEQWIPVSQPPKRNGVYVILYGGNKYWARFDNGNWYGGHTYTYHTDKEDAVKATGNITNEIRNSKWLKEKGLFN